MSPLSNYTYHEQQQIEITQKIRAALTELPPYIKDFYRGRDTTTSPKTRLSYSYDLKIFFNFLLQSNPALAGRSIREVSLDDLSRLTLSDFEEFQEYLKVYGDPQTGAIIKNGPVGIARKLSTVRSLLAYLYRHNMISHNESTKIEMPNIKEKEIIRLEPDEVAELLDYIESCGATLSPHQQKYYRKTVARDLAIVTLLLGTGLRVSECVGLDFKDVDFKNDGVKVTRKGDKEMTVYFGDEVHDALENYLDYRNSITAIPGHEKAFFLSLQKKRISVDAVEEMVKKYALAVAPTKHITVHKLRSTYGTSLYAETNDIYLVADVLGHSDVNTTKKHYAAMSEEHRKRARNKVQLREKSNNRLDH